jgi:hypothetical protein
LLTVLTIVAVALATALPSLTSFLSLAQPTFVVFAPTPLESMARVSPSRPGDTRITNGGRCNGRAVRPFPSRIFHGQRCCPRCRLPLLTTPSSTVNPAVAHVVVCRHRRFRRYRCRYCCCFLVDCCMWKPPPPLPYSSRCSMTLSYHCGFWHRTVPTPAKPMPGGHQVAVALPHIDVNPRLRQQLVPFVVVVVVHRQHGASPAIAFVAPPLPLLPLLRRHHRHHCHLCPPPATATLEQVNRAHVAYVLTPLPPLYLSSPPAVARGGFSGYYVY